MRAVTVILILATNYVNLSSAQLSISVYPGKPVTIASDGYPGLVKTWTNYTSQAYRITQPTQSNLLFLFDRFDLQEGDVFNLCTVEEYPYCIEECTIRRLFLRLYRVRDQKRTVEWPISKGDPIVVFVAYYRQSREKAPQDADLYARGGYRITVMVKEPQREFFECGSTIRLPELSLPTDRPAPIYFLSYGFPNSSAVHYSDCVVNLVGTDGIRFTFPNIYISSTDKITVTGTSTNGAQVAYNQKTEGNLYFQHNATMSFNFLPDGLIKRFAIYVEPFRVVALSCPFLPKTYSNTEFDMVTAGFSTTNYDDNLNCQWKVTDLKPNAQLVLELRSVSLEQYADVLPMSQYFSDETTSIKNSEVSSAFYYSSPNITDAEFSFVTDGLENVVGVNAHLHILDCSNTQSHHTMVSGQTLPLTIPGNNSKSYCQEVLYKSYINISSELALTVDFSLVDFPYKLNFTIRADEKTWQINPEIGMQLVFNGYSNYEISCFYAWGVAEMLLKKIQMILSANPVPIEKKSVCDSIEVIESSSKQIDYHEYSVSSCGSQPIILSELITLRISSVFTDKLTIVISDRFLDNGRICGGVVKYGPRQGPQALSIHYPCMAVVYGKFDYMNISSGSMELYDGFGMKDVSRRIIDGSPATTDVQFQLRQHVFTIRTLAEYDGKVNLKAIDRNNESSSVQIEEEGKHYYIYSSLPQTDSNLDGHGQWQFSSELSTYLRSRSVDVFLELLSPLGMNDRLCVDKGKCYSHSDGLVKTKLSPYWSTVKYYYFRNSNESLLFARVYASFVVSNATTVSTTSVKTTTISTSATTATTTPSSTSVTTTSPSPGSNATKTTPFVDPGFAEAPGFLLMTVASLFLALLRL